LERLKLWRHAYETKVFKNRHEAIGRGPTPEASQKAAKSDGSQSSLPKKNAVASVDAGEQPRQRRSCLLDPAA
jgi:hypothetical protein